MEAAEAKGDVLVREPLVSVIMANFRGAAFIEAALESVLSQTLRSLEVIVSDDASPDESAEIVRRWAARDARVRLIVAERNEGPAAARNRALQAARGEWIAIVDSDDIIHPERIEILLDAAKRLGADGIADDLLFFSEGGRSGTLLGKTAGSEAEVLSATRFIQSNTSDSGLPPLGYLKPLIRRSALAGLSYDESVRIGEDYDFLLRFLLAGRRFFILPEPLYLYRRHTQSISHRLSEAAVAAMIANQEALVAKAGPLPPEIVGLLEKRMTALRSSLAFERLVLSLKRRRATDAARLLAAEPRLVLPLTRAALEGGQSRLARRAEPPIRESVPIILHDRNRPLSNASALYAALGIGREAELIPVPPYRAEMPADRETRAFFLRLAERAMRAEVEVVCHGLAGLRAAGFMPRKKVLGIVIDDGRELASILDRPISSQVRLAVAEDVLAQAPEGTKTEAFSSAYRIVTAAGKEGVRHQGLQERALDS